MSNISSRFKSRPSSSSSGSAFSGDVRGTRANAGGGANAFAVERTSAKRERMDTAFMLTISDYNNMGYDGLAS